MKTCKPSILALALSGLLSLPMAVQAQAPATDDHSAHQAEASPAAAPARTASIQELRQTMRARMQEIRTTQDPERRRQLLEAQMKDMEELLEAGACPQPGGGMMGGRGGQGMMGGGPMGHGTHGGAMPGAGMHHGMGGQGRPGGMGCGMQGRGMQHGMGGRAGAGDETLSRLEALEKRVDLLQMLLQQR